MSFVLFKQASPQLAKVLLPILLVAETSSFLATSNLPSVGLFLNACSATIESIASALALSILFRVRFPNSPFKISLGAFVLFAITEAYISIVIVLGLLLFIFPGVVAIASTFLAPAFALIERQNPFEAIASSTDCAKGNLAAILVSFLTFMFVALLLGAIVSLLPQSIIFVANIGTSFIGLYLYSLIVVVFEQLHPNNTLQQTDDQLHYRCLLSSNVPERPLPKSGYGS